MKPEFKSRHNVSNLQTINCFFWVKVAFFCFKQLPLNDKQKFESHYQLIDAEWLLFVVVGVVCF